MGAGGRVPPRVDTWVAAIYATEAYEDDSEPAGSGIVLDELHILTCHHVVRNLAEQWVAFPKTRGRASRIRLRARDVIRPESCGYVRDLAILVLAEPIPDGVTAAPLRFPEPTRLLGQQWWAFGFPADALGSAASGQVDDTLGHGWIRLYRASRDGVKRGFSGGGLWCPDYQGVVGIVGQAEDGSGDGRAMTLSFAREWFPGGYLSDQAKDYVAPPADDDVTKVAPEVAELARRLDEVPDAMAIIRKVLERRLVNFDPQASTIQLLTLVDKLLPRVGEPSLLQQVSELATERASRTVQAGPVRAAGADRPVGAHCLLVVIRQKLSEPGEFLLSLTLFRDGQPGQNQECGKESRSLEQIREFLRERVPQILFKSHGLPLIEFAVSEDLLGKNFDQWPVRSYQDDDRLGALYAVVVRDLDRMEPGRIPAGDRDMWESRWRLLLACEGPAQGLLREVDLQEMAGLRADVIYKSLRAAFRLDGARDHAVLALLPPAPGKSVRTGRTAVPGVLRAGCHAGIPAAIWLRHPEARKLGATPATADDDDDDRTYLAKALGQVGQDQPVLRDLPRQVRSLRLQAEADQRDAIHPGRRLSLLWADPNRSLTPPELQLPQRSSNGADE